MKNYYLLVSGLICMFFVVVFGIVLGGSDIEFDFSKLNNIFSSDKKVDEPSVDIDTLKQILQKSMRSDSECHANACLWVDWLCYDLPPNAIWCSKNMYWKANGRWVICPDGMRVNWDGSRVSCWTTEQTSVRSNQQVRTEQQSSSQEVVLIKNPYCGNMMEDYYNKLWDYNYCKKMRSEWDYNRMCLQPMKPAGCN